MAETNPENHVDLETWEIFTSVMETGSFLQSARELSLDPSTVSRRLKKLEERFHMQLFYRDSEGVSPTVAGKSLLSQVKGVVEEILRGRTELSRDPHLFHGRFLVSVPQELSSLEVFSIFYEIEAENPGINFTFEVRRSPSPGAAITLKLSPAVPAGNEFVAEVPAFLLASPGYIERRGLPQSPEELLDHRLIGWEEGGEARRMVFSRGGEKLSIPISTASIMRTASGAAVSAARDRRIALGIPLTVANEWTRSGALMRILPDWEIPPLCLSVRLREGPQPFLRSYLSGVLREAGHSLGSRASETEGGAAA